MVCDYGQVLSAATLATARVGGINLHASLLPKYRGAAISGRLPWRRDRRGVIHMAPRVDAGPVIAQGHTHRRRRDGRAVGGRLAKGSWLIHRVIDSLESGKPESRPGIPLASRARS